MVGDKITGEFYLAWFFDWNNVCKFTGSLPNSAGLYQISVWFKSFLEAGVTTLSVSPIPEFLRAKHWAVESNQFARGNEKLHASEWVLAGMKVVIAIIKEELYLLYSHIPCGVPSEDSHLSSLSKNKITVVGEKIKSKRFLSSQSGVSQTSLISYELLVLGLHLKREISRELNTCMVGTVCII